MEPSPSQEAKDGRWDDTAKFYARGMRWVALIGGLGGSVALLLGGDPYAALGAVIVLILTPIAVLLFSLLATFAHHLFYSVESKVWRSIASIGIVLGPTVGPFLVFGKFWAALGFYLPTIVAASVWTALFFKRSARRGALANDRALVTMKEKRGGFETMQP